MLELLPPLVFCAGGAGALLVVLCLMALAVQAIARRLEPEEYTPPPPIEGFPVAVRYRGRWYEVSEEEVSA